MSKPAVDDTTPTHTLPSLAKALGPPDPKLLEALLDGATDSELVELGTNIATPRLLTDDRRIFSEAYDVWTHATAPQKARLRGFSPELLSLAVHHAIDLETLLAQHEGRASQAEASSASRDASAQVAFKAGIALRDQAEVVLRGAAGKNKALLDEIDTAVGTAENGEKLADGLSRLATLGAGFLKHKKDAVATRVKLMRLDEDYVNDLTKAAETVRSTTQKAAGRSPGKKTTQGPLDKKDAEAFYLLEAIVDAFEKAHDIDPTIPRLVPIAMRRLFGKHTRKKPAPSTEPSPPTG